jgi:iron-sulfur cluster assembly accessory protein
MIKRFFTSTNKYPITITDNAWNKMIEIMKKQNMTSFLFTATSGGCSGFNYKLDLLNKEQYDDIYNERPGKFKPTTIEKNHTTVLIDPMVEMILIGTTIDYISEDYKNGIFENKFVFIANKSVASSCGCGVSFTPKIK